MDFAAKWAPDSDGNNSGNYAANLANSLGVRPDTKLSDLQSRLPDFANAVAKHEGYKGTFLPSSQPQSNQSQNGLGSFNTPAATPPPTPTPSVASTHPFNPQNPNSQFVDPNTPSVDTGVAHNLAKVTGLSKDSYAPIPSPLDMAGNIAKPFATVGASVIRQGQSLPATLQGNWDEANKIAATPITLPWGAKIPTVQGQTPMQNLGTAASLASDVVGVKGELPALAQGNIGKGIVSGAVQGALGGEGQYLSDPNRASLKTNQGMLGALQAGGSGLLSGGVTGGVTAGLMPAEFGGATTKEQNDMIAPKGKDAALVTNKGLLSKLGVTDTTYSLDSNDPYTTELRNAAGKYVVPNDPVATKANLTQAIADEATNLHNTIKGGTWSQNNLAGVVKDESLIPAGAKGVSDTQVANIQDYVMELGTKASKNAVGALDVAKQFRANISDVYGENIWNKDTPIAKYIKNVNSALNDFVSSRLPDNTAFQASLRKQSLMYQAMDNLPPAKVGQVVNEGLISKALKSPIGTVIKKAIPYGIGTHLP